MNSPHQAIRAISTSRVVPVAILDDPSKAAPVARALLDAGIQVIEVAMRTSRALDAIAACADVPGISVGAGTVVKGSQVADAVAAGARFLVSPALVEDVIVAGVRASVPVVPGVATATELYAARRLGAHVVKIFPAALLGGPPLVRSLESLGSGMSFLPTGGITRATMPEYLAISGVVAVGGSWMVPSEAVGRGDWESLRTIAADTASAAGVARGSHS